MHNRRAIFELYTVPEGSVGRKEASGVITPDNRLIKQNLILHIVDMSHQRAEEVISSIQGDLSRAVYSTYFGDSLAPFARLEQMAKEFDGTHSRVTDQPYDNASFKTIDRDRIIKYLNELRDTSEE